MIIEKEDILPLKYAVKKKRPDIVDRNGNYIAISLYDYSVYIDPNLIRDRKRVVSLINKLLNIPKNTIIQYLKLKRRFVWIKRHISEKLANIIKKANIRGLYIIREVKDYYPDDNLFSHVVGFTDTDNNGLEGAELFYDNFLNPQKNENIRYNAYLKLTLDRYIQGIVRDKLLNGIKRVGGKWGVAIMMNSESGRVLSLVSLPDYNPNKPSAYNVKKRLNKAISYLIVPGSTLKPIILSLAISKGVSKNYYICRGKIKVGHTFIECPEVHGRVNIGDILRFSCNVSMVKISRKLNVKEVKSYLSRFNLFGTLNIDLPGEIRGKIANIYKRPREHCAYLSIGYSIAITPLELVCALNTFFNEGIFVKPYIGDEFFDGEKTVKLWHYRGNQIVSRQIARKIREYMSRVVMKGGTGEEAYISGLDIAGKTGTAKSSKHTYTSLFVGNVRFNSGKSITLGIIIYAPKKDFYGGKVCAPIFRDIIYRLKGYF